MRILPYDYSSANLHSITQNISSWRFLILYCYLIYKKLVSAQSKYCYLKWNPTLIPDRNMLKQSEAGWTEKLLLAL